MPSLLRAGLLISIGLSLAAPTTAPGANSGRQSGIPACEELLTTSEAEAAMGEPKAAIASRSVVGSTRRCIYISGSPHARLSHSLGVEWGPYADARKHLAAFEDQLCTKVKKKAACQALGAAGKLRPDLRSFKGLELALRQFGVTKWLSSIGFDSNPAFVWLPAKALAPIDQLAFVYVYDVSGANLLQTYCTDNASKTADYSCAVRAAHRAATSIV